MTGGLLVSLFNHLIMHQYLIQFHPLVKPFQLTSMSRINNYAENQVKDLDKVDKVIDESIEMKKNGAPVLNESGALEIIKEYFHNPGYALQTAVRQGYRTL